MEDFGVKIGLLLDRRKSAKQINEEIDSLSKNAKKVKITAGLLKTESKKQIKSDLKSVASGLTEKAIKVKIGVDKEDIKRQIVSAIQSVAQQKYSIEIKPTIVEPTTTKKATQTSSTTTTKTQRTVKEVKPTAVNKDLSGVLDNISKQQSTLNKLGQTDEVKNLINDAENLKVKVKELYNSTDEVKSKSGELVQEYKNSSAELSHRVNIEKTEYQQTLKQINLEKRRQTLYNQMQDFLKSNTNMTKEQANEIKKLMAGLSTNNIDETVKKFKNIQSKISAADKTGKSFIDTITSGAKKFINWYGVSQTIMKGVEALRKMVDAVKDVDAAMTELKKVTDETDATYASYLTKAESQARSVGASVADTVNATADFARLGYSLGEASDLSKAALIYKNVGDGISDVSEASESIISTMKAFNIEATNSMSIVDKFNEVGNNFAISSEGIGEAMQRSAAALATSGNTIDESIGLITGMNAVVQNPEVVGTALKTMTMYLRAAKTEAQSAGEETDGMANSVSELRQNILTLTKNKVDIIPDGKNFKSTYEIVKEIAAVWKDMSEIDQAALLKLIAGKRGANSVASLITNFSDAEKAMNTAANSSGSALKENETYLDSVNGKTAQLKATFESFSNDVLSSNLLKFIIGLGDGALSFADSLAKVNALLPITAALVSAMSIGVEKHKSKNQADDIFEGLVANYSDAQDLRDKIAADDLKDVPELDDTTRSNLTAKAIEKETAAKSNALNALSNSNSTTKREFNSKMELSSASGKLSKNLAEEEKAILGANAARESSIKTELAEMSTLSKISLAITALSVIKAVIDTIAASEQEAIRRGEEAVNNYTQSQETLKNNTATINEVSNKYQELSKGVNDLGENVSLTTDEYAEYNQISNQIADMFPSLIQGYTDEGNAILTCKNNIKELTEAYNESRKAANNEILSNSKDVAKDFADKRQRLIKGFGTGVSGVKESLSNGIHGTPNPTKGAIDTGKKLLNMGSEDRKKYIKENRDYLTGPSTYDNVFTQLGIKMPNDIMGAQELAEYFEKNISTVKATISTYERDMKSATEGAKEIADALLDNYQLDGKSKLSNLPSLYRKLAQSSINNMSFDDASNFDEKTFNSDVQKYVDDTISTVKKLYDNPEFEELRNKMSTIVDADVISKSTANEFKNGVNDFINRLKKNNYSDGFVQSVQDYFQSSLDKVDNNTFTYDMDKVYKVASKNSNKEIKEKFRNQIKDLREESYDVAEEAKKMGVDLDKTVYGNIDLNNRNPIIWDKDTINKNKKVLSEWMNSEDIESLKKSAKDGEETISTILGSVGDFGTESEPLNIAFSPILQTDTNGDGINDKSELLSKNTVYKYISQIVEDVEKKAKGGTYTTDDLLKLDKKGLSVDGKKVKGLIADVGNNAERTSEIMHYGGQYGAVNLPSLMIGEKRHEMKAEPQKQKESWDKWVDSLTEKQSKIVYSLYLDADDAEITLDDIKSKAEAIFNDPVQADIYARKIVDDFTLIANGINSADNARKNFQNGLETAKENEYNTDFNSYADAVNAAKKQFFGENATPGSKQAKAAVDYLFGEGYYSKHSDDLNGIKDKIKDAQKIYGNYTDSKGKEQSSNGTGFIEQLEKIDLKAKGLQTTVKKLSNGKYKFDIKPEEMGQIAKLLGITEDGAWSCVNALQMLGNVVMYDSESFDRLITRLKKSDEWSNVVQDYGDKQVLNYDVLSKYCDTAKIDIDNMSDSIKKFKKDGNTVVKFTGSVKEAIKMLKSYGLATETQAKNKKGKSSYSIDIDKTISKLQDMGYTSEQIANQMEEIQKASNAGKYKIEFTSDGKKLDKKNVTGKLNELLSEQTDLTDDATNSSNQLNESMEKASDTTYSKQISSVQLLSNAFKNVNAVVGNLTARLQSLNGSTFSTALIQSVTDKNGKTSTTKTGLKVTTSYNSGGNSGGGGTHTFFPRIGGKSSAKGDSNVKKSTNSLVGEVAPEIIAHRDTGEWELVEQPQFKALRKGDIVFDGEQTKDILKNGYTTSFGESYVHGTVGKPHGSKTSKKKSKKSSSSKSSTKSGDKLDKALDKFQKWFSKLFDWIEVKLERQTDKISNYIDSAERASDEGRYKSSASAYRKALGATYTQVDYEQRAYSRYMSQANTTMNKGVKNGILSKSRAKSIKKLVANGTIDIKKYNDATQEVIKSYQEWYDKAKDAKDSLSELHDNIRTYIDDLKSLREAERDAKIDKNSNAESIGTGGVEFTQATQMANLRFKNSRINSNNSAYSSEIKSGESDAKSIGGKGKSAIRKELRAKAGKKKGKYRTALKNAQKAIKSKKKVSSSDLNTIRKHKTSKSRKIYESLYAYNLQLDTIEDMKYEAAVEYASNSADYYENLKSQYDVMTDKSNDKISLNEQKSDNAKSAKSKNSYLQSNAKEYDTIVANDNKEIKDYNNRIKSNSKNINTSTKKARGTNYKNASKKQKNTINKFIAKVRGYVKKKKTIPAGDISKLASYYSKGYVSGKFYHSCINYNNALQSKKEAEAQRDIDRETAISEKASIGTSKFENVQNEQENYVNAAQHELTTRENANDLKTTKGGVLSNTDYERVKSANEKLKNTYTNERKALQKQIDENLKNGLWTKSSQEYIEAVEQEKDLDETIAQCTIKQQELNNDIANIPFDNIEKAVSLFDSMNSYLDSIVKLAQALGEELSSDEFTKQIDNNNKKIAENQKGANEAKSNWEKAKKDADNAYGGKSASEWETEYYNYLATINGLKADNQELRNSLIDDVYLASFTKLQEELDKIGDIKSGIKNLIDDSALFDKDGIITKYGTAQLSLLVDEMNNAQKSVSNYSSEIDKLNNLLSSGEITQYEYNERISEVQKNMLSSASDVKSYIDNIISLYKEQAQAEIDAIKKLIDARKKALDAKKSYYEYDKTISDKNKDIQSLKAQIAALEGIETAEAKAKKAQLNAQLTEQQDDLNDTINSHMLELSSNALDELSESLQDSFDDYWDKLWLNLDNVKELIEAANKTTADAAKTTADALNSLLSFYGIPTTQVSGYASGSKYIDRNKLALTQENGSEIIVRRSDGTILTPLKRGDGVIPHDLTQNLYKWGQNSPANFMSALTENATNIPMAVAPQYNIEQSFDSLIRVDGNVDSTVVGDLEKFAQSFYKGAYDYTIKSIASDARKLGIKV